MTIPQGVFGLADDVIYLNHAAVAPWPLCTAKAASDFAQQNAQIGATLYPAWVGVEQGLRDGLARLIHAASADEIALVKNTSEALSFVAAGIDWVAGDQIVGIADDFPSNRFVWQSLEAQGVRFKPVDIIKATDPESVLIDAISTDTRLLAVSSVHYATGLRLDLNRLGQACRDRGILFCVDAIQSLGVIPFDVQACQADFIAADGHKWLLGPEGLGLFYCRAQVRDTLKLTQFGWHMVEDLGNYTTTHWTPAQSGRRFECGSPNMLGIHALAASIAVIEEIGVEQIFKHVQRINHYLIEKSSEIGLSPTLPHRLESRCSGIVTLALKGLDATTIWQKLMDQRIVCAPRGGGLRISPHIHNTEAQVDQLVGALASLTNLIK